MKLKYFFNSLRSWFLSRQKNRDIKIEFKGSYKPNLNIEPHTYINSMVLYCWDKGVKVDIGRYCSIADDVCILAGGEHHKEWVTTYPFINRWQLHQYLDNHKGTTKGDVQIGHDVWIGHGATVLSGVSIGTGAVIGARAVVAKDVPPYAVVVGNPAKIINYRFDSEQISILLESKWWCWDESKIMSEFDRFMRPNKFFEKHLGNKN